MDILPQLLVNALITGSIYALVSSGLALSYGLLKVLNFAHGHIMMVGAYCYYLAYVVLELGIPLSLAFTLLCSIALGALTLGIFIAPFSRFSVLLTFVTTLAFSHILEAIISMTFGVNVKSLDTGSAGESIEISGVYMTPIQLLIIGSAIVLLSLLALFIHSTPAGRKIRALSIDPLAAQSLGVSRRKISYGIFILGTIFAAFAGILVGYETNMQPTMGGSYTIKAFAAMILGGLGNIWGTLVGSYLLGLVENLSIGLDFWGHSLPAGYKDAFAFLIILFTLLLRPQGLIGHRGRKV